MTKRKKKKKKKTENIICTMGDALGDILGLPTRYNTSCSNNKKDHLRAMKILMREGTKYKSNV